MKNECPKHQYASDLYRCPYCAEDQSNSSSMACSTAYDLELQHRINMAYAILKSVFDEQPTNRQIGMALDWLDNDNFCR